MFRQTKKEGQTVSEQPTSNTKNIGEQIFAIERELSGHRQAIRQLEVKKLGITKEQQCPCSKCKGSFPFKEFGLIKYEHLDDDGGEGLWRWVDRPLGESVMICPSCKHEEKISNSNLGLLLVKYMRHLNDIGVGWETLFASVETKRK